MKNLFFLFVALIILGCSFDYGASNEGEGRPDIVMENIEYARVRRGELQARFRAESAQRWEDQQIMEIGNLYFEQYDNDGENINAIGRAGSARMELRSGNIFFSNGVFVDIESEDIIIRTGELDWIDNERILRGNSEGDVEIERSDGTIFTGRGFFANARSRIWEFSGEVRGTYVD